MIINSQQNSFDTEIDLRLTLKNKAKKIRDLSFAMSQKASIPQNKNNAIKKQSFSQMFSKITNRIKANIKQEHKKSFYQSKEQKNFMVVQTVQINKKSKQKQKNKRRPTFSRIYSQRSQDHSLENQKNYSNKQRIFKGSLFSRPHKLASKRMAMNRIIVQDQNKNKQFLQVLQINKQHPNQQNLSFVNNANNLKQKKFYQTYKPSNIKHIKSTNSTFKLKYFEKKEVKDSASEKKIRIMTINSILVPTNVKDFKLTPWNSQQL